MSKEFLLLRILVTPGKYLEFLSPKASHLHLDFWNHNNSSLIRTSSYCSQSSCCNCSRKSLGPLARALDIPCNRRRSLHFLANILPKVFLFQSLIALWNCFIRGFHSSVLHQCCWRKGWNYSCVIHATSNRNGIRWWFGIQFTENFTKRGAGSDL